MYRNLANMRGKDHKKIIFKVFTLISTTASAIILYSPSWVEYINFTTEMILNFNKISPTSKILLLTIEPIIWRSDKKKHNLQQHEFSICVLNFPSWQNNSDVLFLKYFFLKREETIGGRKPLVRFSNAMATKIDHFSEITRSKLLTLPNFSLDLSHDHYEVTLF